jgi:4'-phosphopantetheinyl transferase
MRKIGVAKIKPPVRQQDRPSAARPGAVDIWWAPRDPVLRDHDVLRRLLSRDGRGPVELRRDQHGKLHPVGRSDLSLSLSYSGPWAVYAIGDGAGIGVDCEAVEPHDDLDGVAHSYFTPAERALLARCSPPTRLTLFYRLWTRKEALVKALGLGLSYPIETLSVARIRLRRPCPLSIPGHARHWVCDLPAPPGYVAACASRGPFTVQGRSGPSSRPVARGDSFSGRIGSGRIGGGPIGSGRLGLF